MPLVGDIQTRFREILKVSTHVEMAVAWATSGWTLDRLADAKRKHGVSLHAIVGTYGNATDPDALERLDKIGELRLAPDGGPLFGNYNLGLTRASFGLSKQSVQAMHARLTLPGT